MRRSHLTLLLVILMTGNAFCATGNYDDVKNVVPGSPEAFGAPNTPHKSGSITLSDIDIEALKRIGVKNGGGAAGVTAGGLAPVYGASTMNCRAIFTPGEWDQRFKNKTHTAPAFATKIFDDLFKTVYDEELKKLMNLAVETFEEKVNGFSAAERTEENIYSTRRYVLRYYLNEVLFMGFRAVNLMVLLQDCFARNALMETNPNSKPEPQGYASQAGMLLYGGMGGQQQQFGGGFGAQQGAMGVGGNAMNMMMMQGLRCESPTSETQDYKDCVSVIQTIDRFVLVEMGVNQGSNLYMQNGMTNAQIALMKNDGTDQTMELKQLRDQVGRQSNTSFAQAGAKLAKAGALKALNLSFPTRDKVINGCINALTPPSTVNDELQKGLQSFLKGLLKTSIKRDFQTMNATTQSVVRTAGTNRITDLSPDLVKQLTNLDTLTDDFVENMAKFFNDGTMLPPNKAFTADNSFNSEKSNVLSDLSSAYLAVKNSASNQVCATAFDAIGATVILPAANQNVRELANMIALQSGIEGATAAATGAILVDQKSKINQTIDDINNQKKKNNDSVGIKDARPDKKAAQCDLDPTLPECQTDSRTDLGVGGFQNITLDTGAGVNTNMGDLNSNTGTHAANSAGPGGGNGSAYVPISGASGHNFGNGDIESPAGKAEVKNGAAPGAGGGAGAPGGGGGASAPDIGQAPKTAGAPEAPNKDSNSSAMKYVGGGGPNSVAYNGPVNRQPATESKSDNPFNDLFGKKPESANDPNLLQFGDNKNGIASDPRMNIWSRIHQAHTDAIKNKRLLEYEIKK